MKKAVLTIAAGEFHQKMAEISHPLIRSYAHRVGADFIVWDDDRGHSTPHYRKLDIYSLLDEYDRVLYVDTDILIREDAPDLFKIVPENSFAAFDEGRFDERAINMQEYLGKRGVSPSAWNGKYYNTGVLLASKCHKPVFFPPIVESQNYYEQTHLNFMLHVTKTKIYELNYKFNRLSILDKFTGEERHDSYFLHYAGAPREMVLDLMQKDLKVWENAAPEYRFGKNVAIIINGGIGDQIAAEPVARYIRDKMYKGDNIVIVTDFPDLFDHLDLPVYSKKDKVQNVLSYYQASTYNGQDHDSWNYMSHISTHAVDFCSLQAIRSVLPVKDKQIKLSYGLQDLIKPAEIAGKLSDLVLLHPGKGWQTKTFPVDVWQGYADALVSAGYRVGIIGKRMNEEQGIVEIDMSRCIDFVDKLSLKETIALISQAPVLISNDSSPVHMAGAFDNWIGLIATCKNSEYILPYRNGSIFHKAAALEEEKMYERWNLQPSQVDGNVVHLCTEDELRPCLPSSAKVLRFVRHALSNQV